MNCSDCRAAFRAWHRTSGNLERATFMCGRDADGPPTVLCLSRQLAAVTADRNNAARVLDVISRALRGEPLPPDTVDLALEVERVVVQRARAVAACRLALAEGTMPWESMEIVKAVVAEADKEVKP